MRGEPACTLDYVLTWAAAVERLVCGGCDAPDCPRCDQQDNHPRDDQGLPCPCEDCLHARTDLLRWVVKLARASKVLP